VVSDKIICVAPYQDLDIDDVLSLIEESSLEDRWDLLVNKLNLEIIES
jgi:hypothetical protein